MGWSGVLVFKPIANKVGWGCIGLFGVVGASYTIGIIFFALEKPNPFPGYFCSHEIWHCFILVGIIIHYLVLQIYV